MFRVTSECRIFRWKATQIEKCRQEGRTNLSSRDLVTVAQDADICFDQARS
jgi:hypothetical protein